jgi:soluble lytic murein transglycosylase-like protein
MRKAAIQAALAVAFTSSAAFASALDNACEREMLHAAQKHGVPLGVLYAVGMTESGRAGGLRPSALNIEGNAVYDLSRDEALRRIVQARQQGAKLIDVGCMQINAHYHGSHFNSVADMLDPAQNVDYAARFLRQLRAREGNWTMAVARYNAGPDNNPAQKKYICRVIANLVATGFGQWTKEARGYCDVQASRADQAR